VVVGEEERSGLRRVCRPSGLAVVGGIIGYVCGHPGGGDDHVGVQTSVDWDRTPPTETVHA